MSRRGFFGALMGGVVAVTGLRNLAKLPVLRVRHHTYRDSAGSWLRSGDVVMLKGAASGKTEAAAQFTDGPVALPGTAPWRATPAPWLAIATPDAEGELLSRPTSAVSAAAPLDLPSIWPGPSGAITATASLPPLAQVDAPPAGPEPDDLGATNDPYVPPLWEGIDDDAEPSEIRSERVDPEIVAECARLDQSDTDNGQRLLLHFGKDLLVLQTEGADAADAARFAGMKAARDGAIAAHAATIHEQERLKADLFAAENGRKGLDRDYGHAQGDVGRAAAALDREKSAMMSLKREVEAVAGPLSTLSGAEAKLKAQAEGVTAAMGGQVEAMRRAGQAGEVALRQSREAAAHEAAAERAAHRMEHGQEHHGFRNYALTTAAMAVSAHEIVHGIEAVLEHGAEYQHALVALRNAGRTPEEIGEMNEASHAALRGVPTATLANNLEILNETVGAFGSVEHAIEHLGFMNKAATILHATAGGKITESAGEMGNAFAKFFEMRGTAGNSKLFESEAGEMMKSMVFTGGNVNPRELLLFAQQAKSALQNYDIHFLSRVAPSLIGEVGGERAGTQANAFAGTILGKARDAKQTAAWIKYGLIDEKQTIPGSKGPMGWNAGAIYHTDEFLSNPLEAMRKYVLPALAAKGIDVSNKLELTKAFGTMFRNSMANAFANELAQASNITRLDKDAGLIRQVEDPDAIYKRLLETDPTVSLAALKGSLGSFFSALSSPLMEPAARNLSGLATTFNDLAIAAHEHPVAATVAGLSTAAASLYAAGKLSYGLLNGFGNATFGAAAGEMAAAGHEQLGAGRIMLTAAEAMRVGALERDIPGIGPAGKAGARAAVREGEVLAEGAAEAAIGQKIVGAIEGGMKGGLAVEALEVATAGAVTLTAGTAALTIGAAALTIAALSNALDPKKRASDQPGYGRAFAPNGFDPNNPDLPRDPDGMSEEEKREQAKPWYNRNGGAHPRGSVASQKDTDQPGHWVTGPHGRMVWSLEDRRPLKNAPFFSTAPIGADGLPTAPLPSGLFPDSRDKRTWAHIAPTLPAPNPDLYAPADVPVPPERPGSPPPVAAPTLGRPPALPSEGGPVPVRVVSTSVDPHAMPGGMTPAGTPRDFTLGNRTGNFSSPGLGTDGTFSPFAGHHAPGFTPVPAHAESLDVAPHIDLSGLDTAKTKVGEAKGALAELGAMAVFPQVSSAPIDALIAKLMQAKSLMAGLGSVSGGGSTGGVGVQRTAAAPNGGRQGGIGHM